MSQFINLPKLNVSPEEHKSRLSEHIESGRQLADSIKSFDFNKLNDFDAIVTDMPEQIYLASNPKYANLPFGAVATLEEAGSIAFVSKFILDAYDTDDFSSLTAWKSEIENKGYVQWRFKRLNKGLSSPSLDFELVSKELSQDELGRAKDLDDLIQMYGKISCIGGSAFLIDNVIRCLSIKDKISYKDTRLQSVDGILQNLSENIFVPIRVQNNVYHNNAYRTGGHYVILLGIQEMEAFVFDSSKGFKWLPATRLFDSIAAGLPYGLVSAWNIGSILG